MYTSPEPSPLGVLIKSSNQEGRWVEEELSVSRGKICCLIAVAFLSPDKCPANPVCHSHQSWLLFSRGLWEKICDLELWLWSSTVKSAYEEIQYMIKIFRYWNLWDCDKLLLYLLFVYRICPQRSSLLHPTFYKGWGNSKSLFRGRISSESLSYLSKILSFRET